MHAVVKDGEFWHKHLRFRNIMRQQSELAVKYAALKVMLSKQFPTDIESYIDGKTQFVTAVLANN